MTLTTLLMLSRSFLQNFSIFLDFLALGYLGAALAFEILKRPVVPGRALPCATERNVSKIGIVLSSREGGIWDGIGNNRGENEPVFGHASSGAVENTGSLLPVKNFDLSAETSDFFSSKIFFLEK